MLDLKKLLNLLANLHDGWARSDWPHPIKGKRFISTETFWRQRAGKYKLKG